MKTEIKIYSPEQATRLTQFHRAEKIVGFLRSHDNILKNNCSITITDELGETATVDKIGARIMTAALYGMFDELLDAGLRTEIIP